MPRIGTPEYYRQKRLGLMTFTGFFTIILYSTILSNQGRLIADLSLVVGVIVFVVGLALLGRERIKQNAQGS